MPKKFKKVTLERTVCDGECPVFKVTILGDGQVDYDGKRFVKELGKRTWRIDQRKIDTIATAFESAHYDEFEDEYPEGITCQANCNTSIEYEDSSKKSVEHYLGDDDAPKELSRLEGRIEALIGVRDYVGEPSERQQG